MCRHTRKKSSRFEWDSKEAVTGVDRYQTELQTKRTSASGKVLFAQPNAFCLSDLSKRVLGTVLPEPLSFWPALN